MVTKRGKQASRKAAARKYGFLAAPSNIISGTYDTQYFIRANTVQNNIHLSRKNHFFRFEVLRSSGSTSVSIISASSITTKSPSSVVCILSRNFRRNHQSRRAKTTAAMANMARKAAKKKAPSTAITITTGINVR
ncbi:MAG: hypothetical protein Q8K59_06985 [Nitrosomonas sp.]|nr:hypothetical protein [Nitrosomonas sp.]